MNIATSPCLLRLKDSLCEILSSESGSLVLSKQCDNTINIVDLLTELHNLLEPNDPLRFIEKESGSFKGKCFGITNREREVLSLILEEFTTQEISEKLFISVRTVDNHRASLLSKLGAKNSLGLAKIAYKYKLITFP
ncbi:response regulator transcription factor [uncultured Sphingobacterium sp.]|uniref:response regulator transcription factor n=1 Tax=uncultured Sphingobacterium sp. TaxID=182688 RepID=UPI00374A345B